MKWAAVLVVCGAAFAQQYEVGALVGYGWYRDGSIYSSTQTIQAGIRNRFAAGILIGDDFSKYVSLEYRYLFHDGHPFIQGSGVKTDIQGQSHTLTAEGLFHFAPRDRKVRPFLAGGVGGKEYVIAGPEPFPQPLPNVVTLTDNDVWKVVFAVGGGVKVRLMRHMVVRGEFRDYLTTFPRQQIVPAAHNTARGVFQQFTPMFAVAYEF